MAIAFQKIKWNGSQVQLCWTEETKTGSEHEHTVRSYEAPAPELVDAMTAFVPFILKTLELPDTYAKDLRVTGISLNTEDDGRRGVVVTSLKQLSATNAPLVLNTPHLREQLEDGEGGVFMPDDLLDLIANAERAADGYLKGQRAQMDLFQKAA